MLEELNRAEIPVMQPALQLLSARRLHDYTLPAGWFCVAAINPDDGDYQVNELDPAMRSRFLQLTVRAERSAWLDWAVKANVHPIVRGVVETYEDALDQAPPRSWAYVSDLLHVLSPEELRDASLLESFLCGYLPPAWSVVVARAVVEAPEGPTIDLDLLLSTNSASRISELVQGALAKEIRTDALHAMGSRIRWLFSSDELRQAAERGDACIETLEGVTATLPGDIRQQCLDTLARSPAAEILLAALDDDVATFLRAPIDERASPPAVLGEWLETGLEHRLRVVMRCVTRALSSVTIDNFSVERVAGLHDSLGRLRELIGPDLSTQLDKALTPRGLGQNASFER